MRRLVASSTEEYGPDDCTAEVYPAGAAIGAKELLLRYASFATAGLPPDEVEHAMAILSGRCDLPGRTSSGQSQIIASQTCASADSDMLTMGMVYA
jgi:hypothetical protein